jgi:hypothetical protein
MTYEEAIKTLKEEACYECAYGTANMLTCDNDCCSLKEAIKVAIEALEKQIPKKLIIWENKSYDSPVPNDDWGYECPCCGDRDIDYPEHHCECGQALDWSEDDDR